MTQPQLAIAATVLGFLIWALTSWSVLLLTANLLYGGYCIVWQRRGAAGPSVVTSGRDKRRAAGVWRITLVNAEIVTDEPWSGRAPCSQHTEIGLDFVNAVHRFV